MVGTVVFLSIRGVRTPPAVSIPKVKPEDKEKIESKIKEAKEILAKTETKADDLNKASDELGQILQTVGAAIYQQQQPGTPGPEAGQTQPGQEPPKADETKEAEEGEVVQ